MAMKTGEKYRCPDPDCGCEIEVKKDAEQKGGDLSPRCCCGQNMEKV